MLREDGDVPQDERGRQPDRLGDGPLLLIRWRLGLGERVPPDRLQGRVVSVAGVGRRRRRCGDVRLAGGLQLLPPLPHQSQHLQERGRDARSQTVDGLPDGPQWTLL